MPHVVISAMVWDYAGTDTKVEVAEGARAWLEAAGYVPAPQTAPVAPAGTGKPLPSIDPDDHSWKLRA